MVVLQLTGGLFADDLGLAIDEKLARKLEKIDGILDTSKQHSRRIEAYANAIYLLRSADPLRSLDYFDKGLHEAEAANDSMAMGRLYFLSSMTYTDFGLYNNAIRNAEKSLEFKPYIEAHPNIRASVYNNLAVIYEYLNEPEMHKKMLLKALSAAGEEAYETRILILLNLGTNHLYYNNLDSAAVYLNRVNNLITRHKDSTHYIGYALARVELDIKRGNTYAAERKLENVKERVPSSRYITDMIKRHILAAEIEYQKGNYGRAITETDSSLAHLRDEFNYDYYHRTFLLRNMTFVSMGLYDTASKVLIEYVDTLDNYYSRLRTRNLQNINTRYELEKDYYHQKVDELNSERRRSNFLLLSSFFGLILFGIIGFAFLEKQKSNKLLRDKNKELLSINKKFTEFLEQSAEGFCLTDSQGSIIIWNKSLAKLSETDSKEIIGKNLLDVIKEMELNSRVVNGSGTIRDLAQKYLLLKEFEPYKEEFEVEFTSRKGIIEIILFPILFEDENYFGAIVRDITTNKQYERDLVKAKNVAERSDKMKTEFLAQMSHEIRSPLNVIISFTSLIEMEMYDDLTDDQRESFKSIQRAGNRIIRTIDMLLNMSELLVGSYEYTPDKINLCDDVIPQLVYDYTPLAQKKGLELEVERYPVGPCIITADEYSIQQTFENLISNAVKYTQEGKITIRTAVDGEERIFVEIEDTGIGISEEYLDNLFTPFTQEEQGYTRTYEGNGLGLALVKKYCEINNADITVKSQKGKGSVFRVTFLNSRFN